MYRAKIKKERNTGKRIQSSQILKEIPQSDDDIFIEISGGQSLNTLANKYYGKDRYWRVIAHANNIATNFPPIGTVIRIPKSPRMEFIKE